MVKARFQNNFKTKAMDVSSLARDLMDFLSVFVTDVNNLMNKGITVADNINAEIQDVQFQPNQPLTVLTKVIAPRGGLIIASNGVAIKQQSSNVDNNRVILTALFDSPSPVNATVYIFGS